MYTNQSNVEAALKRSLTTEEVAFFTDVVGPAVDEYINKQIGTSFGSPSSADVSASGDNTSLLIIPDMQTVGSIKDADGTTIAAAGWATVPSTAPFKAIRRIGGIWDKGLWNYTLNGEIGTADQVPADLAMVATELVSNELSLPQANLKMEKVGEWWATYADTPRSLSTMSQTILQRYKRLSRST